MSETSSEAPDRAAPSRKVHAFASLARADTVPRLVAIRGAVGVGKTQFTGELSAGLLAAFPNVDRVRCEPATLGGGPAMATLVRQRLGIPTTASPDTSQELLRAAFSAGKAASPMSELALEFFAFILGALQPDFRIADLDESSRWEGARVEMKRWLETTDTGGWLWILEDAQLGDPETAAFLDWMLPIRWSMPVAVVVVVRDEPGIWLDRLPRWLDRPESLAIELGAGALPPDRAELSTQKIALLPNAAQMLARRAAFIEGGVPAEILSALPPTVPCDLESLIRARVCDFRPSMIFSGALVPVFTDPAIRQALLGTVSVEDGAQWLRALEPWCLSQRPTLTSSLLVARALQARTAPTEASAWLELASHLQQRQHRRSEALDSLRIAAAGAQGIRALVLMRRVAEEEAVAGNDERALETLAAATKPTTAVVSTLPAPVLEVLDTLNLDPLDDWRQLTLAEARVALSLVRAEILAHLGRGEETRAAFSTLESRLRSLTGTAAALLWVRWLKTWSWFLAEMSGAANEALDACDRVRAQLSESDRSQPRIAAALIRAEEIAASRVGDSERAIRLADQQLALARASNDPREEAIAWNAKAIHRMSGGDLVGAHQDFERSLTVARAIGFRRREAISLHNVGLVLCDLGRASESRRAHQEYVELSRAIGNAPAQAYGPASLAVVALFEERWDESKALIAEARQAATEHHWTSLLLWARALSGQSLLLRSARSGDALLRAEAQTELSACLDEVEKGAVTWTEEFDPGEAYAGLALCAALSGKPQRAREVLLRARSRLPASAAISHAWLSAAEALALGRDLGAPWKWFAERSCQRALKFFETIRQAVQPP